MLPTINRHDDSIFSKNLFLIKSVRPLRITIDTMLYLLADIKAAAPPVLEAKKLCIIKGASHLFEEEGSLEEVGEVATNWLTHNFMLGNNSDSIDR